MVEYPLDFQVTAIEALCNHYQDILWSDTGLPAREYLYSRGFTEGTLKTYRVGFATKVISLPITDDEEKYLLDISHLFAGRADRFGNRIVFPVSDARGTVRGFSGRIVPPSTLPKYMNSSEAGLYRKSSVLFGLDIAREAIFKANKAIVCEGYTDVMAFRQAGIPIAVASMGTSLTIDHLRELSKYTDSLYFAFDGDSGGDTAQSVATSRAKEIGFKLGKLQIPSGEDPASYLLSAT